MSTLQTNVEYLSSRITNRDNNINDNKLNQDLNNEGTYIILDKSFHFYAT